MNKLDIFKEVLKDNNLDFIFVDNLNILSNRKYTDNFEYIFKTKNSCDAMPMMKALENLIKDSTITFDVGANIGITSVWLARNSVQVYAFEPEENNVDRLKEQIKLNKIDNISIIQSVVSEKENKTAILNIFDSYGHHSLSPYHVSDKINEIKVQNTTIDIFCKNNFINKIDCLKIDVEGFELEVLKGASKMLKHKQIKLIILEHSPILLSKQNRQIDEVLSFLTLFDYKVYTLDHKEVTLHTIYQINQTDLYAK